MLAWKYPPNKPVKKGWTRHQYFLTFDKTTYSKLSYQEKANFIKIALNGFEEFAEINYTKNGSVIIKAWMDIEDEETEETEETEPKPENL